MGEGLGTRIKTVKRPIASDPQHAGPVFEQRINVGSGEAVHSTRFVHEYLEFVAVVAVETVLRTEPDETAIVLDNLRNAGLRKTFGCRNAGKPSASALDDGDVYHSRSNFRRPDAGASVGRRLCRRYECEGSARQEPSSHGGQGEDTQGRAYQSSVVRTHARRTAFGGQVRSAPTRGLQQRCRQNERPERVSKARAHRQSLLLQTLRPLCRKISHRPPLPDY